jgi:hypothetical protein
LASAPARLLHPPAARRRGRGRPSASRPGPSGIQMADAGSDCSPAGAARRGRAYYGPRLQLAKKGRVDAPTSLCSLLLARSPARKRARHVEGGQQTGRRGRRGALLVASLVGASGRRRRMATQSLSPSLPPPPPSLRVPINKAL